MTINDIIDFEDLAGITWDEFLAQATPGAPTTIPTGRMLQMYRALLFIDARRTNPDATLHDAGQVTVGDLNAMEVVTVPATPTDGGESRGGG